MIPTGSFTESDVRSWTCGLDSCWLCVVWIRESRTRFGWQIIEGASALWIGDRCQSWAQRLQACEEQVARIPCHCQLLQVFCLVPLSGLTTFCVPHGRWETMPASEAKDGVN